MIRILFLFFILGVSSVAAQATPIVVIGSGSDQPRSGGSFNFAFQNSDGAILVNFSTALTINPLDANIRGGQPFFLNFIGSGLDVFGTLVTNGVTYPAIGNINIEAAQVLAPTTFIPTFHVFTSFTFTGGVIGFDGPDPRIANEVVRYDLIGAGTLDATVVIIPFPEPLYRVSHITYTLQTPEPISIVLLLTGIGAVALRLRSRANS